MGFYYRRRVRADKHGWFNVSRSGVSYSHQVGRVTVNTRGNLWVRLARGLFWRGHL